MKKILFVSDSPVLNTGFGKVLRKIAVHMSKTYEVKVLGWFSPPQGLGGNIFPFQIIPTRGTSDDTWGQQTFPDVVESFKPDMVFGLGDSWMVRTLTEIPNRKYHLVLYCPVDGAPLPPGWVNTFSRADTFVAYLPWAKKVIEQSGADFPIKVIPHGVDTDVYHPMKREDIGPSPFPDGKFVTGCIARNQPRKQLPRLLKTFGAFLNEWTFCPECASNLLINVEKCQRCGNTTLLHGDKKSNCHLYMHASNEDCGWNLRGLAERFGISDSLGMPEELNVGGGMSEDELARLYNWLDVFTLPTSGEGFGLPILEAMACGVPALVTNYSAHVDFCGDEAADLIGVSEFVTEPGSCVERALVDMTDYYMRLERFYYEKEVFWPKWGTYLSRNFGLSDSSELLCGADYRAYTTDKALMRAQEYSWKHIMPKWDRLFEDILGNAEPKGKIHIETL